MKRIAVIGLACALVLTLFSSVGSATGGNVPICHRDPATGTYSKIWVKRTQIPSHRRHGDRRIGESVPGMDGYVFDADCVPARTVKVSLCHRDRRTGTYSKIQVREWVIAWHRKHGDARPGEPVPGMDGYSFDDNCVPVRDEVILAVAYTNLDGIDGFDPDDDVLISKLVDANGDAVPSVGDLVITDRYPKNYIPATDADFRSFRVTSHTVTGVWSARLGEIVLFSGSNSFIWQDEEPNVNTVSGESYVEGAENGSGLHNLFYDVTDGHPSSEILEYMDDVVSDPDASDSVSVLSPANDPWLEVDVIWTP